MMLLSENLLLLASLLVFVAILVSKVGSQVECSFPAGFFAGDQRYFIDLGDFCWGNHLFDVGMVYLCCCLNGEDFIRETFHMSKSLAIRFWESFAPE